MFVWRTSSTIVNSAALLLVLLCMSRPPGSSALEFDPMVICRDKPDDSTVMNPVSCELFMLCKNNMPVETGQCPDNMLFNAEKEYCDFPDNVDCGSVPRPPALEQTTEASAETTSTPASETCPSEDDPDAPKYLSVADDCSSYVLCYHGKPLKMTCPVGLEWNKAEAICDTPENAKCQAIYKDPFGCPEQGTVFLPHPDLCQKFIFCLDGISRVQVCQMFKIFDPIQGECVPGMC